MELHYLQIRGIHGEHSESEGGIYDSILINMISKNLFALIFQSKSDGIELSSQRRASHLPRPPPINSIIKSNTNPSKKPLNDNEIISDSDEISFERIEKSTINYLTRSVPTDLHDITEQKEMKVDVKKYYPKNKKYRNDIIVCDNIRNIRRNNEELSQSIATQNEYSLYNSRSKIFI